MSYHPVIKDMQKHLRKIKNPKVLEIGIDTGATFFVLAHSLTLLHDDFKLMGIDIFLNPNVRVMISNWEVPSKVKNSNPGVTDVIELQEINSLDYLKDENNFCEYDLILLDGDHNYYTVSRELEMLHKNFTKVGSAMIIDDYRGKWSKKDMWYVEGDQGIASDCATKKIETEKHGVASAVDDFMDRHCDSWVMRDIPLDYGRATAESVLLQRKSK